MRYNFFLSLVITFSLFCLFTQKSDLSDTHKVRKDVVYLDSEVGQQLFNEIDSTMFTKLKKQWRPQLKNYCGVCSSVIVTRAINEDSDLTQESFFSPLVEDVIPSSVVERIGLTLRELGAVVKIHNPNSLIQKNQSDVSGCDLLLDQLESLGEGASYHIVNFSQNSLNGEGEGRGHFAVIAGFHMKSQKVLILEVRDEQHFWVGVRDLYDAMLAKDSESKTARGWLTIQVVAG